MLKVIFLRGGEANIRRYSWYGGIAKQSPYIIDERVSNLSKRYIKSVVYDIVLGDGVRIAEGVSGEYILDKFDLKIIDNKFECRMKERYTQINDVRKEIEAQLEGWVAYQTLKTGVKGIEFRFKEAIVSEINELNKRKLNRKRSR